MDELGGLDWSLVPGHRRAAMSNDFHFREVESIYGPSIVELSGSDLQSSINTGDTFITNIKIYDFPLADSIMAD